LGSGPVPRTERRSALFMSTWKRIREESDIVVLLCGIEAQCKRGFTG
jgi:hypothetical protein